MKGDKLRKMGSDPVCYRRPVPRRLLSLSLNLPDGFSATASASSLLEPGSKALLMVDISNFTTSRIVDKRPESSAVEYKCEFKPIWLAADLVETA